MFPVKISLEEYFPRAGQIGQNRRHFVNSALTGHCEWRNAGCQGELWTHRIDIDVRVKIENTYFGFLDIKNIGGQNMENTNVQIRDAWSVKSRRGMGN